MVEPAPLSIADGADGAANILQQLMANPGKNSATLLKDPAASTPPNWHLWLPPHFNSALDLRFLQKQKTKQKEVVHTWKEWVQGGRFQFNEGSILYDRDVSGLGTWGEKLEAIKFYILITAARPVSVKIIKEEEGAQRRVLRHPGQVSFSLYASNPSPGEDPCREMTMSQDDFVRFAITGQW